MTASSRRHHMEQSHALILPQTRAVDVVGVGTTTYLASFPWILKSVECPVTRFPEISYNTGWMLEHFMYRHFLSKVTVLKEGKDTLPHCNICVMHMPAGQILKYQRNMCCF